MYKYVPILYSFYFSEHKDSINLLCHVNEPSITANQNYINPNTWNLLLNVIFNYQLIYSELIVIFVLIIYLMNNLVLTINSYPPMRLLVPHFCNVFHFFVRKTLKHLPTTYNKSLL